MRRAPGPRRPLWAFSSFPSYDPNPVKWAWSSGRATTARLLLRSARALGRPPENPRASAHPHVRGYRGCGPHSTLPARRRCAAQSRAYRPRTGTWGKGAASCRPRKGRPRQALGVGPVGLSRAVVGAGGDAVRGYGRDPAPLGRELPGRNEAGAAGLAGPVGRLREPRHPLGRLAVGVPAEGPRPRLARRGVHGAHGGGAGVRVDPENSTIPGHGASRRRFLW